MITQNIDYVFAMTFRIHHQSYSNFDLSDITKQMKEYMYYFSCYSMCSI